MNPISVSELTRKIKWALTGEEFQNIALQGEVSNFVHHSSGHMYFSLKDDKSRIKVVMFRSRNQRLGFVPKNGETLIAVGSLGIYEPNGEYQLYVDVLLPQGIGELHLAFEHLKAKLEEEGLFDPQRKRPLPFLPQRVGIITSPTGAAIRDILQVLQRRHPGVQVLVFPALVQGEGAPESLLRALDLAQTTDVDVLIIGRGGGSFEELSAFNDEVLARAIASCSIPIVSAVGHETDFTIADFVADLRAPTPSAAAELVVPKQEDLKGTVIRLEERLQGAVLRFLTAERRYLNSLTQGVALQQPQLVIRRWRQRVDELWTSIGQHQRHDLELRRAQLSNLAGKLETLSPLSTLSRGYSICQDRDGQVVRRSQQVQVGEVVQIRLHEGGLVCKVEGRESGEPGAKV